MKKKLRKLLATLLIMTTCLSTVNVSAYASEISVMEQLETISGNDTISNGDVIEEGVQNEWDGSTESIYEAEDFKVTFKLMGYWDGGYNASVRIDNLTDLPIESWKTEITYDGSISNIWNAQIVSNDNGKYVIKNAGWNQDIAAGSYVEFGFSGQESFSGFPTAYRMLGEKAESAEEEYTIDVQISSDWGTGYTGIVTITNNAVELIEDWVLEFDCENEITSIWNGVIEAQEGTHYVIKNAGYNQNIEPNGSVSFGFIVNAGSSANEFHNFVLSKYSETEVSQPQETSEPQREKEPLESIGEAYYKEVTEADVVVDEETGIQYARNQLLVSAFMGAEKYIFEEIAAEVGAEIVGYIELTNDYQLEFTEEKALEELTVIAEYIDSFSFVSCVTLNIVEHREIEATQCNDTLYNDGQTCFTRRNHIDTDGDGVGDKSGMDYNTVADTWNEASPSGDNWDLEALNVLTAWDNKSAFDTVKVGVYDAGFDYDASTGVAHEDLIFDDVVNNPPMDKIGSHGTHVAGILAAQHNNNRGVSGIATDTRLYAYATGGNEYGSSMGDKIVYATLIGNHVKVINVSLGMSYEIMFAASHPEIDATYAAKAQNVVQAAADVLEEYLNKLVAAGYDFVICTSAGNTNATSFVVDTSETYGVRQATATERSDSTITKYKGDVLAYYDCALTAIDDANLQRRIIVVGSMKNGSGGSYSLSSFSNVGDRVDVVAPGEDILSTVPTTEDPERYALMGGTSMASPQVASLVAMMFQVNPGMRASNAKTYMLLGSSKNVSDGIYTYPLPDAVGCYTYALNAPSYEDNDNTWPSGIVCGYTKDADNNTVADVKITAIRKNTGEYNLGQYSFSIESDSNGYYLATLPQGTYDFIVSKSGYLPYSIQNVVVNPDETTYMETIVLSKWVSLVFSDSEVQGTVKNALNGNAVSGATVKLRKGWNNQTGSYCKNIFGWTKTATTASDGTFSIDVSVGTYTAEISKNGYVTAYYNVISGDTGLFAALANVTMVLTPVLSEDEYRIVLTWGDSPSDLDSHLTYYVEDIQKCHVYYANKIGRYDGDTIAKLDLDDVTSYGPETVTITLDASIIEKGGQFRYSIHNFSEKHSSSSNGLSLSNATIHVYAGNELINTYHVPKDQVGTVWHVFDITEEGIEAVNEFYNAYSASGVK